MRSSDYAGLATLELKQHLRHRQHTLLVAACRLRREAGESEAALTQAGCARLYRGVERMGDLLDRFLDIVGSPPRD